MAARRGGQRIFGTTDLAPILARIARGRDLEPTPIRRPSVRKPVATKPVATPGVLAKDRRRPIGAVLVDICLDLGIVPGQIDRATWDDLRLALALYGGPWPAAPS